MNIFFRNRDSRHLILKHQSLSLIIAGFLTLGVFSGVAHPQESSPGIELQESTQSDGTKIERLCISELPQRAEDGSSLNDLTAPTITLSAHDFMTLEIVFDSDVSSKKSMDNTPQHYGYYGTCSRFTPSENDLSIVAPYSTKSAVANVFYFSSKPYLTDCWDSYVQTWIAKQEGSVTLSFQEWIHVGSNEYHWVPITLQVPIEVGE